MAACAVVFDRLFGSFAEERADVPCRYGLTTPLVSNNPLKIAFHEWLLKLLNDLLSPRIRCARSPSISSARPAGGRVSPPHLTSLMFLSPLGERLGEGDTHVHARAMQCRCAKGGGETGDESREMPIG